MTIASYLNDQARLQSLVLEVHKNSDDITDLEGLVRHVLRKVQKQSQNPQTSVILWRDFHKVMYDLFEHNLQPSSLAVYPIRRLESEVNSILQRLQAVELIAIYDNAYIQLWDRNLESVPMGI